MSLIDAVLDAGPFSGFPLGAAMAIAAGTITPAQAKAAIVAKLQADITAIEEAIVIVEALPDVAQGTPIT